MLLTLLTILKQRQTLKTIARPERNKQLKLTLALYTDSVLYQRKREAKELLGALVFLPYFFGKASIKSLNSLMTHLL